MMEAFAPLMRYLPAVLLSLLVVGCTLLPERTARQTFELPAANAAKPSQQTLPQTLRILTPHTEAPLNGTHILVNPEGHTVQSYGGARWIKATPVLLRDAWIDALRKRQSFQAVVNETSDATSDLSLASDLNRFQLQYPGRRAVVAIQADVQLLESESGQVLATRRFDVAESVSDQPVEALIDGFGSASERLSRELMQWLETTTRQLSQETDPATQP